MAEVEFSTETQYHNLGRNRWGKPCGIQISVVGEEIHLLAINGRGKITQGLRLVVPMAHVRDLRDALDDILQGLGNHSR
jgi:hypothetical protein